MAEVYNDYKNMLVKKFAWIKANDYRMPGNFLELKLSWNNKAIIRRAVAYRSITDQRLHLYNKKKEEPVLREQLLRVYDETILNYDDLTKLQKKRLDKTPPIKEVDTKYAILKSIRVRTRIPSTKNKAYIIVNKIVICELKKNNKGQI